MGPERASDFPEPHGQPEAGPGQLLASPGVSARVSRAKPGVPCCPPPTSACPADARAPEAQLSSCCPGMPGSQRPSQGARTQAGRGECRTSRSTPLPPPQLAPSLAERAKQKAGLGQVSWKTGKGKGTPGLPGAWAAGCPASGGALGSSRSRGSWGEAPLAPEDGLEGKGGRRGRPTEGAHQLVSQDSQGRPTRAHVTQKRGKKTGLRRAEASAQWDGTQFTSPAPEADDVHACEPPGGRSVGVFPCLSARFPPKGVLVPACAPCVCPGGDNGALSAQ